MVKKVLIMAFLIILSSVNFAYAGDNSGPFIIGDETEAQEQYMINDSSAPSEARCVKDRDAYCGLYYYMGAIIILILLLILFCMFKAKGMGKKTRIFIIIMSFLVIMLLVAWTISIYLIGKNDCVIPTAETGNISKEKNAPKHILYLKPENGGQIAGNKLENYPEVMAVYNFEDLQEYSPDASAIWIDKDSADLVEEGWLDLEPQKNYVLVMVGYNNALYSFREILPVSKISSPYIDWTKEEVEPGFSMWKLKDQDSADDSANSLNAVMRGYQMEVNIEALFIATNRLLEKENYRIAEVFEEECSIHSDCEPRFEYMILSHCPYESRCINKQCAVVCPHISDPEWFKAIQAISNCEAETIFQGHDLFVTVNLKNGEKISAFESRIDEVIKIVEMAEEKCGKIMIGTE